MQIVFPRPRLMCDGGRRRNRGLKQGTNALFVSFQDMVNGPSRMGLYILGRGSENRWSSDLVG